MNHIPLLIFDPPFSQQQRLHSGRASRLLPAHAPSQQYDYRPSARIKATFHSAIRDLYHRGTGKPGRRSVECRLILTFDAEQPSPASEVETPLARL